MPDDTITLKDIFERLIRIETLLNGLTAGNIINGETEDDSPFFNPETKLYDMKYYRENLIEKDK